MCEQHSVSADLVHAGGVDDGGQSQLAGRVDQDSVGLQHRVQELVNARPPRVNVRVRGVARLQVDDHPLDGAEGVVDGEVELELLHQQQLVVEDDLGGALLVARDVGHELQHGHVELLHLAGEVDGRDEDLLGVVIHHGVVEVEPGEVVECRPLHVARHRGLELITKFSHFD